MLRHVLNPQQQSLERRSLLLQSTQRERDRSPSKDDYLENHLEFFEHTLNRSRREDLEFESYLRRTLADV